MQFGQTLHCILKQIQESNPRYSPISLLKIDIIDAFYWIGLNPTDVIYLRVLFPSKEGENQLIGIPLVLPMGRVESPPAFYAGTKPVANRANTTTLVLDTVDNESNLPSYIHLTRYSIHRGR